ncbi:MAG: phosphotransferase [Anaerolineae bacterium]|nr:phosphotransferase [Anaerolineae bacterium]
MKPGQLLLFCLGLLLLVACSGEPTVLVTIETQVVTVVETRVVEVGGETVVEEVVVTRIVEMPAVQTVEATKTPTATQSAASSPTPAVTVVEVVVTMITAVTPEPAASPTPRPSLTATSIPLPTLAPTPTVRPTSSHQVEVEWPPRLRTGESGLVRLALFPIDSGYIVAAEMADSAVMTEMVRVEERPGYELQAAAALHGVAFSISPESEQWQPVDPAEPSEWRWTVMSHAPGNQTLNLILTLHWRPQPGQNDPPLQKQIFGRSFPVNVRAWLGLTMGQTMMLSGVGLALGTGLSWPLLRSWLRPQANSRLSRPNPAVIIEPHPAIPLNPTETSLLQAQFRDYARVLIEAEFRSGYSGARTLLALPIHADNRHDAAAISKIGSQSSIEQEFANYEQFVQNTLPPMTARILARPLTIRQPQAIIPLAALRYTFIGEPGQKPTSLRQQLLADPDPAWLEKLFRLFAPHWWRQHEPYRYRLASEFDRKLPSHLVIQPLYQAKGQGIWIDGRQPIAEDAWQVGDVMQLRHFQVAEQRAEGSTPGGYLALLGQVEAGQTAGKVRWLGERYQDGLTGRVVATRRTILTKELGGIEGNWRERLQTHLLTLPHLLNETVQGTRSVIHGDLNLENVLVGPEGVLWLIDFAETRMGPPVYDFAHLGAELIAHLVAPQMADAAAFQQQFSQEQFPLLVTIERLARQCLFDPENPREYYLALALSCLGALKFSNLSQHQKNMLAAAAVVLFERLRD